MATIKQSIINWILKKPVLSLLVSLVRRRKDKNYIDFLTSASVNSELIQIKAVDEFIDVNYDRAPVCRLTVGNKNEGFFATYRWMLDALYFCDRHGIIPIVSFTDDSLYKDNNLPKELNPFEYYFECATNGVDTDCGRSEVIYVGRNSLFAERLNSNNISYEYSKQFVEALASVQKKYIKFNDKTQRIVTEYVDKLAITERTLGVHIRGTDYKQNCKDHPKYVGPEDYYPVIDKAFQSGMFDKVFLATDDNSIFEEFIKHYGSQKIVCSEDTIRGTGNIGTHVEDCDNKKRDNYRLGLEVICDMFALSTCGGMISGMSQVGLAARVYKLSQDKCFAFDRIISKGINQRGKIFRVK